MDAPDANPNAVQPPVAPPQSPAGRKYTLLLGVVLLLALGLRLPGLTQAPPGLNQDEATNAWNAWCLLKCGRDQAGAAWPIFYTHGLGGNRSTLYLYALLPFQLCGGLNVWTTRLPAAIGGVLTVLLLYWCAARLYDRPTALLAAALLTLSPWHIQLSRLGHEASLGPLLVGLSLAALLWAGFPLRDGGVRPVAWRALLAGLLVGVSCYGYPAVRLFLPPFLALCFLATWRAWSGLLRERRAAIALLALLVGVGVTFGPLAYQHIAHPEQIAKRADSLWLWDTADSPGQRVQKVAGRYLAHFGPGFLFLDGDHYEILSPRGFGVVQWYMLPLLLAGLVEMVRRVPQSAAARVGLCWLLAYPAGDCLHRHLLYAAADGTEHMSLHMLRSAPGLGALTLAGALGAVVVGRVLWRRWRAGAQAVMVLFGCATLILAGRFCVYFFGEHNRQPVVRQDFHADLVEACEWLRPRVADADAIFVTTRNVNMPYIVTLVTMRHDPRRWFDEPREMRTFDGFDYFFRVGKFHFLYDSSRLAALDGLLKNDKRDRVYFIVRPGESRLRDPIHTIYTPAGEPSLLVFTAEV
ncbi:MAG: glycosyltransferase family 39 protein [Planctomycetes bacterium]|nr:glycosyltransferase family 39 protein [Planctomycetota bacterium]